MKQSYQLDVFSSIQILYFYQTMSIVDKHSQVCNALDSIFVLLLYMCVWQVHALEGCLLVPSITFFVAKPCISLYLLADWVKHHVIFFL
jgi:hypothetical protein